MIKITGSLPISLVRKMQKKHVTLEQIEDYINGSNTIRGKNRKNERKLEKLAKQVFKESETFSIYF